jgi:hypothetical protein
VLLVALEKHKRMSTMNQSSSFSTQRPSSL